ncbi:MAG TPA: DUF4256 domain-containing protein, partial [Bacteroidia bacterium]|nr:DUF4256 domain-containing protein [Bacteroidia bacterium]
MPKQKSITEKQQKDLLEILHKRFIKNMSRHKNLEWQQVADKIVLVKDKMWSLYEMENTGGEPDVVDYIAKDNTFLFFDCATESPAGRRSLAYDKAGQESRKEFKPVNNAIDVAASMGINLLNESQYRFLQTLGKFDCKTSSWIITPESIRKLGGALFGDYRYDSVFIYHNGAQSYYAA